MQLFGRQCETGEPIRLDVVQGTISRVAPVVIDARTGQHWPWISPGFLDIQVNGCGGQDFGSPDLTPEKAAKIVGAMDQFGVARLCPTVMTNSFQVLRHALETIAAACESSAAVARRVAGVHLEGPYISPEDGPRGAHPREHCRPPDWDEFQRLQEAAGGRIRLLTLSPESAEAPAFIRRVVQSGVVVAIGHTAADAAQLGRAVDAGARLCTHLGNGCHRVLPRHANYLWDQLADDRLMASLIADGHHLPPTVLKTFLRAKTPSRCILISDMSGLAGAAPGRYASGSCDVEVLSDGRLTIAGQRQLLAGASRPIGDGIANLVQQTGIDLAAAVRMATVQPAALLGLEPRTLDANQSADIVQFYLRADPADTDRLSLDVRATVLDGEPVWGVPWRPELPPETTG